MTTPDRPRGVEALSHLSFRDVVLPQPIAMGRLHQRSVDIMHTNLTAINVWASGLPQPLRPTETLEIYRDEIERPGFHVPAAGLYVQPPMLDLLYQTRAPVTFRSVISVVKHELEAKIENPALRTARLPTVEAMSNYLDLIHILNPQVAYYDEGVALVLKDLRETSEPNSEFTYGSELGWMIDDTLHLRTDNPFVKDYLADSQGAQRFLDTVLRIATPLEKEGIKNGMREANVKAGTLIMDATRDAN